MTLASFDGKPVGPLVEDIEQTPYGAAKRVTSVISFPGQDILLGLRIGSVPGAGIVLLQPFLKNNGAVPVRLISLIAINAGQATGSGLALEGSGWLLTSLDRTTQHDGPPVSMLDSTFKERTIRENGGLYRPDGTGFFFGPVGEPAAYLSAKLAADEGGGFQFSIASTMSWVTVDPGEARDGQEVALWFRPPREALARWAEWVGQTHHARHDKGPLSGWCSWYHLTEKITGKDVLGVVDEVLKQPDRLRPQVIQIDDGFQDYNGVWQANAKFPEGMAFYAKKIAETGARPGLWIAPTLIDAHAPWMLDPKNRETVWDGKFFKEAPFRSDESGFIDPTHPRARRSSPIRSAVWWAKGSLI